MRRGMENLQCASRKTDMKAMRNLLGRTVEQMKDIVASREELKNNIVREKVHPSHGKTHQNKWGRNEIVTKRNEGRY